MHSISYDWYPGVGDHPFEFFLIVSSQTCITSETVKSRAETTSSILETLVQTMAIDSRILPILEVVSDSCSCFYKPVIDILQYSHALTVLRS